MTKPSTRCSHLVRHGLIGTSLVGAAAGTVAAEPCDYRAASSVGFVLGVDFTEQPRLIGGVEARTCLDERSEAMVRFELGGAPARLVVGARARPFETPEEDADREHLGLEGGLAFDAHQRFGLHGAVTLGHHWAYAALQTRVSMSAGAPSRFAIVGGFSPFTLVSDGGTSVPGRPLHDGAAFLRPRLAAPPPSCASAEARAVQDHYVDAAQLELSSVWTFLRLAHELAAVGAPPALVAAALDAADDEVRHAEMCARAAGGVAFVPLPMAAARPRFARRTARALAVLAAEAWREGCLNEGAAAEEARLAAADAQGDARAMLQIIATDEARHAALSRSVLVWVMSIDPAAAHAAMPASDAGAPPRATSGFDRALARHGVPSPSIKAAALAHASREAQRQFL